MNYPTIFIVIAALIFVFSILIRGIIGFFLRMKAERDDYLISGKAEKIDLSKLKSYE